jgi:hypothetical protein
MEAEKLQEQMCNAAVLGMKARQRKLPLFFVL